MHTAPVTDDEWRAMVEFVHASRLLEGGSAVSDRLLRTLPDSPLRSGDEVVTGWRENATGFVVGALRRRAPEPDEDDTYGRELGRARAHAGVTVAEMLQAVLLQQRIFLETMQDQLPPVPHRERMLLELYGHLQAWSTWFMISLTDGHREAERAISRRAQELENAFVWRLISGTATGPEDGSGIEAYGLDRTRRYYAFRARISSDEELEQLERFLRLRGASGRRIGMMTLVDGDACGFTARVPRAEPPVAIGVSFPRPLAELPDAFRQATRALETTLAFDGREIADLGTVGLHAAMIADRDVGRLLYDRYLAPLLAQGETGQNILDTVERFVTHCGRIEPVARDLKVHANTVRYRLSRFELLTNCSLQSLDVVAEIWCAFAWGRIHPGVVGLDMPGPSDLVQRSVVRSVADRNSRDHGKS